jgi:hypothetical protein
MDVAALFLWGRAARIAAPFAGAQHGKFRPPVS